MDDDDWEKESKDESVAEWDMEGDDKEEEMKKEHTPCVKRYTSIACKERHLILYGLIDRDT